MNDAQQLPRDHAQNGTSLPQAGGRATVEGEFSPRSIQDVVAANFCDLDMTVVVDRPACRTRLESVRMGPVDVLHYQSEGMQRGNRRWEHIRRDHADFISLYMPMSMEFHIENIETSIRLSPESFAFIATNRPFSLVQYHNGKEDHYSSIYVKVPATLLRQRVQSIDDLCCRSFSIEPGASGIMKKVVEAALHDGPALSATGSARFGETMLDVIAGAAEWAAGVNGLRITSHQMSRQRVVEKAKQFIEENLSDPGIDTAAIAEHCRVSVRYLHSAFSTAGESVAGYVRERRLQLCRAALRDPLLGARTITKIASDWGFPDPSHFGKIYRNRFSRSPKEDRQHSCKLSERLRALNPGAED